ncbi:MAG: 2-amino-4-hydroxy-6-hydroxymethyldihydropteridine diphosphokinase [Dysgonamonadaceae bacterium]|jgi:2-amino-4-hydroxy-6-hydroxymethyldihydropteridine diphosphokinase|nr:2-amino-4-hydroxy-6-hydroxymethyldihydropteridine diphosphokinase [Dysgonamonadaceae bacterium]
MHHILLSIGSNTYAKRNTDKAKRQIETVFPDIRFSESCTSKAYGKKYKRPFLNLLAAFESDKSAQEICKRVKQIESEMGRKPEDKEKGRVVIDIDLIRYDDNILKQSDFERSYVQDLLKFFSE